MELPSPELRISFERAVSQYQSDLAGDTAVQTYLSSRGFGPAVAGTFRLGVVRRPIEGHERFFGRLCIPYLTRAGVVNISFRCLKPHLCKLEGCPKYLPVMDGMERNLFNVNDLFAEGDYLAVCEGELDAISLSSAGIPAVGIPGATNWKKHWRRALEDHPIIYAVGDGDEAGATFNAKLMREARAIPVKMPQGEDCNAIYARSGPEGLRALFPGVFPRGVGDAGARQPG